MEYIECRVELPEDDTTQLEIFVAELAQNKFESFVEESPKLLLAYIQQPDFEAGYIAKLSQKNPHAQISYKKIEDQNWNKVWEENYFKPLLIANKCLIKSTFHNTELSAPYQILIDPKMAFGTGHHETTSLIVGKMFEYDFRHKIVLDMGTGTGILAILARMLKATKATAIDNDIWAYNNTLENLELNNIQHVDVIHGDKNSIPNQPFDIIIANINRNILLADVPVYANFLNHEGIMFLSGFYKEDIAVIDQMASQHKLILIDQDEKKNWVTLIYKKTI